MSDEVEVMLLSAPGRPRVQRVDALLEALDSCGGPLAPQHINEDGEPPYSREAVRELTAVPPRHPAMAKRTSLFRKEPEVSFTVTHLLPDEPVDLKVRMSIAMQWFAVESPPRADMLVALVRAMAEAIDAVFGFVHSRNDLSVGRDEHYADPYAPIEIVESHWVDVLGPALVEKVGRDRMTSLPAEVVPLGNGGVLIRTTPTPVDYLSPAARAAQARVLAHLTGEPLESVMSRLAERSARLAPVEPKFDPDVADFLMTITGRLDWGDQPAAIVQWNGFRPPEPDEWLPADQSLPSDVADIGREIDRYVSLLSEQLVALLHKYVGNIGVPDPRLLPEVDAHFWVFNYPGQFLRSTIDNDLVPAVGAWLGEILVHNLGGKWVPRRAIDESQVIVGARAWLPFRRARRYLVDQASVASYSLNQFYQSAQRHSSLHRS